ncbi:hypothetical protein LWI28_003144 [Acer negundo]|uniref:Uncharacterized protein n=1 Tax=Acer negundo TaxID=4023 RepID=A0AAD5JC98_ACENE|nr:hypothetical protein LWI28_003144 [Acer negundo]
MVELSTTVGLLMMESMMVEVADVCSLFVLLILIVSWRSEICISPPDENGVLPLSLVLPPIRVFLSFQAHYNQMIGKWLICTWMLSSGRLLASIGPPVFNNNSRPTIPDTIK